MALSVNGVQNSSSVDVSKRSLTRNEFGAWDFFSMSSRLVIVLLSNVALVLSLVCRCHISSRARAYYDDYARYDSRLEELFLLLFL